jgi:hypothetical protein
MDTFNTLKNNLIRNYAFYIPTIAIEKLKATVFEGIIPIEACDTLAFFDNERIISTNFKTLTILKLTSKKDILDENILLLFEAKKNLDSQHFLFLLNNYIPHVEGHLLVTNLMLDNIGKIFEGVEEHIINIFKLQLQYFQKHNTDLNLHFEIQKQKTSIANEKMLKHLNDTYSNPNFKIKIPDFPKSKLLLKQKVKPVKKKKVLPSDEDIDRFLLTTVFNVEL